MFNAHLQLVDGSLMRKIRQRSFQSYEIIEFSLSWISIVEIFSLPLYAQPLPLENPLPSIFFLFFFSTLNMGTESCCVGDLMSPTISPILDTIYIYIYIYIYILEKRLYPPAVHNLYLLRLHFQDSLTQTGTIFVG